MGKESKSSKFWKWLSGIVGTVIAAIIIFFLTRPGGFLNTDGFKDKVPPDTNTYKKVNDVTKESDQTSEQDVFDISGIWYTPEKWLAYNIVQEKDKYYWNTTNNKFEDAGIIKGDSMTFKFFGKDLIYKPYQYDSKNNPTVLWTENEAVKWIIMFRDCTEFKKFLKTFIATHPNLGKATRDFLKNLKDPTCPNVLD